VKVLIINKFLYPNGGSETYIFKLGEYLSQCGHEVQYFGMEHEGRCVGNNAGAYTSQMDFRGGLLGKASYAVKTIYSREARVQIRKVLDDFKPDVCHLNNFNYQLTPSIILEIVKWRKRERRECRIVFTAHDYQLVCPNHMMNNPVTHENCEKCLGGHFSNCFKGKCIHGSRAKSLIGTMEAVYWNWRGTYRYIDKIICCSEFLKTKMDTNPVFAGKTVALHNFIEKVQGNVASEGAVNGYVLYFGRFSHEKGVGTLIEAAKRLPEIQFVCAGSGEYGQQIETVPNMKNVGFKSGEALDSLIRGARFSVCPSEWYENCPFSVMESQERGTPVVGARIGGIPELVDDGVNGFLFESGNVDSLVAAVEKLWNDETLCRKFEEACLGLSRDDVSEYVEKLKKIIFE
jgi:glycosyltransferase involved in cell wall biosynthesis